jgi:hypothetical protein
MKIIAVGMAWAMLLTLSACTTQPLIPYDRASVPDNKTIGLLTPGWPSGPSAVLATSMGQSFGLIGAIVDATMQSNRESELKSVLAEGNVDASTLFVSSLTSALQGEGYTVTSIPADQKRSKYLKTYPAAGANNVDSYLDITVMNYGYISAGMGDPPYRPWVQVQVKLVKASDSSVLMQDTVSYNSLGVIKNVVTISPDPAFVFPSWSNITADKILAAKGVTESVSQTATTIAGLMK